MKLEVEKSFDRAGIAWLPVEGSKSYFISWSKFKNNTFVFFLL